MGYFIPVHYKGQAGDLQQFKMDIYFFYLCRYQQALSQDKFILHMVYDAIVVYLFFIKIFSCIYNKNSYLEYVKDVIR